MGPTVLVVMTMKVIQGRWFLCYLERDMPFPISDW